MQCASQRVIERRNVAPYLALVNSSLHLLVTVLDRILYRDDVTRACLVDMLYHSRKRRGLTRARGSCYKHKTSALFREIQQHFRHTELNQSRYLRIQQTYRTSKPAALVEHVYTLSSTVFKLK